MTELILNMVLRDASASKKDVVREDLRDYDTDTF